MKNACCARSFSKPFYPIAKANFNGYPNDGKSFVAKENDRLVEMTNEYFFFKKKEVVPCNSYLRKKFQVHINVENVFNCQSCRNLHQYICKDYNSTNVKTVNLGTNGRIHYYEFLRFVNMRMCNV